MAPKELWLQVSAGQGPAECAWAVPRVVEQIQAEAGAAGVALRTVEVTPGPEAGTAHSVLLALAGGDAAARFAAAWRGTVQWIARSPFRPQHKRRNWFVGVEVLEPPAAQELDSRAVRFETMRASGPGGQHVNRTESAVRATHVPTGLQATASEERSQHRNKALAVARLAQRLREVEERGRGEAERSRWRAHQELERGNPVRTFRGQ